MKYILIFLFSFILFAAEFKQERIIKKHGVKLSILGSGAPIGLSYDYFIVPILDIELTAGLFPSVGLKIYPIGYLDTHTTFYLGTNVMFDIENPIFPMLYFPLGVEYTHDNKITVSGEIGVISTVGCCFDSKRTKRIYLPFFGFKLGERFD